MHVMIEYEHYEIFPEIFFHEQNLVGVLMNVLGEMGNNGLRLFWMQKKDGFQIK